MNKLSNSHIEICLSCGYNGKGEPYFYFIKDEQYSGNEGVICPSCNYQPGYSDAALGFSFKDWRHKWIQEGAKWGTNFMIPPVDWNAKDQLNKIGVILDDRNNILQEPEDPIWHYVPTKEELVGFEK